MPVWYRNAPNGRYEQNGFLPNGNAVGREGMAKWAVVIAEKFPKAGFCYGNAYHEEFVRIIERLGLKVPEGEMTDETCIHCLNPREPNKDREKEDIYTVANSIRKWNTIGSGKLVTQEELDRVEI